MFFLSDLFVLNPGMAYAWALAIIPSVAIAATIITTSIARDRLLWNTLEGQNPPRDLNRVVWAVCIATQWGLILLSYFNLHHPSRLHYLGVALFATGGVVLQMWVVILDYGISRNTWHPVKTFDRILVFVSFIALPLFGFGSRSVSAASEWVVLLVAVVLHTLLPIRGARVVLSKPEIWYNSRRSHDKDANVSRNPDAHRHAPLRIREDSLGMPIDVATPNAFACDGDMSRVKTTGCSND